ncbi:MAG: histidine kinase [Acidithiobacillales bacterium SM23_46]|nr:MAG: histidine kinase [Acidithiobacillales bacterium SM23_46]
MLLLAAVGLSGCGDRKTHARAVYLLVDTSGTYAQELDRAEQVVNFLLGTLNPGDSLAVARVKSRSFTEKDIVAKATFAKDPLQANGQKRAFKERVSALKEKSKGGSAYTDITGGILQAAEFLNETGAGRKTILIFSDMQEELDAKTVRNVNMNLTGIRVVALNVTKLATDNVDPKRYYGRLESWEKRVKSAGAAEWRMINDLEHLERMF